MDLTIVPLVATTSLISCLIETVALDLSPSKVTTATKLRPRKVG